MTADSPGPPRPPFSRPSINGWRSGGLHSPLRLFLSSLSSYLPLHSLSPEFASLFPAASVLPGLVVRLFLSAWRRGWVRRPLPCPPSHGAEVGEGLRGTSGVECLANGGEGKGCLVPPSLAGSQGCPPPFPLLRPARRALIVPRRNRAAPLPSPCGGERGVRPASAGHERIRGHTGAARRRWRGLALRRPPPSPLSSFVPSRFPLFPCRSPLSSSGLGGGRASWARRFARFLSLPFLPAFRRFLSSPSHLYLHSPPPPLPRRRLMRPSLGPARVGSSHRARGSRGDAPLVCKPY